MTAAKNFAISHQCFIKPHLDYGYIIYDQSYKIYSFQKLESKWYNAVLTFTNAMKRTSR